MPNPVMPMVDVDSIPADMADVKEMLLHRAGETEVLQGLLNNPALTKWFFNDFYGQVFYNGNGNSKIDLYTKELIRLRMALMHGCYVCRTCDTIDALNAGVSQEKIDNLYNPTSEHFDDRELALIELADQINFKNPEGEVTEEHYARLKKYFTDEQIVELGLHLGIIAGAVKFFFVFNLVTKEGACPLPSAAA